VTGQAHLNTGFLRAGIVAGHGGILDQAGAAWAAAEQAAYDEWQAAMNAAESTYIQAESQAWNQYLERLDELNLQLEHTREILEAAFQTAWNNFVRDWTEMESEAWDAYQLARAQMLRPPPEGQRNEEPQLFFDQALASVVMVAQQGKRIPRAKVTINPATGTGRAGENYNISISLGVPGGEIVDVNITGANQAHFNFPKGVKLNGQGQGQIQLTVQGNGLGPAVDLGRYFPDFPRNTWGWDVKVTIMAPDGSIQFGYGQLIRRP
jgi:hypothetical protein